MKIIPRLRPLALLAALAAAAAGIFALVTWNFGQWRIATYGTDYIPMAPVTAMLFVVLGLALATRLQWPESGAAHWGGVVASGLTLLIAGIEAGRLWFPLTLPWDQWFMRVPASVGSIPVGRMSPLSAGMFLLTAVALLGQSSHSAGRTVIRRLVYVTAGTALMVVAIVAGAYAVGRPLLYYGSSVPMALLTALAFMALNSGLLLVGQVDKLLREIHAHESPPFIPPENRAYTRRLILSLCLIGGLICLTAILYLRQEERAARAVIKQQLEAIANLKVDQITDWRNERLGEARFLNRTPAVINDVASFVAAPGNTGIRRLQEWLDPIKGGDRYSAIMVCNPQQEVLLAIPAGAGTGSRIAPELFAQALASTEPVFGDLQRDADGAGVHLDLLVPLRPARASASAAPPAPIAVIVLRMDPDRFLFPLIEHWPVPSATAETVLVRREGDEVVYLNKLRHRPDGPLALRRPVGEANLVEAMAARGLIGVQEGFDYRGIPDLCVIRRIPGTSWILLSEIDQAEAYLSFRRDALQTSLMVLVLLAAAALAGTSLWRARHADSLRRALLAEHERKAVADRLSLLTQHANDIILLMDGDGRILEANERALAIYGYTLAELRALPPGGLRPDSARGDLPGLIERIYTRDGTVFETVHQCKDGALFPVEGSGRSVVLDGRRQLLGIFRDITERKAHEREIERLNRMYYVISQVNQAIVRGKSRDGLFTEVCRVLVEFGRFRIAWIGWHNPVTRMIDPVATAGDDHGYVPEIRVSSDPAVPEGRGPSGTAFREGRISVCNDFFGDPALQPWHERARPCGFQSSIALPLRLDGAVLGLLTVYAAEKDFFGPQEIRLLEEAADDVSFATGVFAGEARRQSAEAALRENESLLREAQHIASFGSYDLDAVTGRWRSSEMLDLIFGIDDAYDRSVTGWETLIHPDDRAAMGRYFQEEVIGRQQPFDREYRIIRQSDRAERWVWGKGRLDLDAQGVVRRMRGTIQDITERKQAEQALREQAEIISNANDAITVRNSQTDAITFWNQAAERLYGYTRQEAVGKVIHTLLQTRFPLPLAEIRTAFLRDGYWRGELTHTRRDGTQLVVSSSWSLQRDSAGVPVSFIEINANITELKQAELRMRAALVEAQRFREAQDYLPAYVYIKDLQSRYVYANKPTLELFRCTAGELAGSSDDRFFPPEVARRLRALDQRVFGGETTSEEIESTDAAGRSSIYSEIKVPIYSDPERTKIWGLLGVSTDITERKQAERELRETEEKFSKVFHSAPVYILLSLLEDGIMLDANEAFLQRAGYRREEIVGRRSVDIGGIKTEDRRRIAETMQAEGRITGMDLTLVTKSGEPVECIYSGEIVEIKGRPCILSIVLDISERKAAERKLKEQLDELRRWHEATLGREDRILELKREVNRLLARTGSPPAYPSAQGREGAGRA